MTTQQIEQRRRRHIYSYLALLLCVVQRIDPVIPDVVVKSASGDEIVTIQQSHFPRHLAQLIVSLPRNSMMAFLSIK